MVGYIKPAKLTNPRLIMKVQGDPRRPGEVNMWAPSPKAKEDPSASGTFLTIAASVLGCAAIFLKVRCHLQAPTDLFNGRFPFLLMRNFCS